MNRQLKEYYKQIKKALRCPKPLRDGFLRDTKRMADDFLCGRPDATFDELKRFLGEPVELASTFMGTFSPRFLKTIAEKS